MHNYVVSFVLLWFFFTLFPADETLKKFQEENPLRPYMASRTLIVNEKDPRRIIVIKGETLIFIRGDIIEVTIKEVPIPDSMESTDEDN